MSLTPAQQRREDSYNKGPAPQDQVHQKYVPSERIIEEDLNIEKTEVVHGGPSPITDRQERYQKSYNSWLKCDSFDTKCGIKRLVIICGIAYVGYLGYKAIKK